MNRADLRKLSYLLLIFLVSCTIPEKRQVQEESFLTVCSFNIQFLGSSTSRDNAALAALLKNYDLVVIQELVAPPFPGFYPDSTAFRPDPEAAAFFTEMISLGFDYFLSEEDTGTGERIHLNSSATEWWVSFYRPETVEIARDLPGGFLAEDTSNHPDFERVPYAFPFRAKDGGLDLVLISVHLKPGSADGSRRKHELGKIAEWINDNNQHEKDFIILGDMNIEDQEELIAAIPAGFVSLNDDCIATNTNINGPKPYDHVFYQPEFTSEADTNFGFAVIDLIDNLRPYWDDPEIPYPGDDYDHNLFRKYFSDHHPVAFRLMIPDADDD